MPVRIPCSAARRGERRYAQLIFSAPSGSNLPVFQGAFLRCGALVDDQMLWPDPGYPEIPLLHEYTGSDGNGRGHNRSTGTHILWQLDVTTGTWQELGRASSCGPEWFYALAPIVRRELRASPAAVRAADPAAATSRVIASLDAELQQLLDADDRRRCMSLVYDQFTARLLENAG